MPNQPAHAATADIRALFGTSALKYKACADRLIKDDDHWKLKIVCSFKDQRIDKLRTKVSVCLVHMAAFRLIRSDFLHSG